MHVDKNRDTTMGCVLNTFVQVKEKNGDEDHWNVCGFVIVTQKHIQDVQE